MKHLRARIAAEIADAAGRRVNGRCKVFCMERAGGKGFVLEVVVLTIEAVKRAGLIEDGQVGVSVFRAFFAGISGIPASRASWTHKVCHAVGRERVVIEGDVSFVGSSAFQLSVMDPAEAAESDQTLADPATVRTDITGNAFWIPGGPLRQAVGLATSSMNLADLWPYLIKTASDAIHTKADDIGNGFSCLVAITASAHGVGDLGGGPFHH